MEDGMMSRRLRDCEPLIFDLVMLLRRRSDPNEKLSGGLLVQKRCLGTEMLPVTEIAVGSVVSFGACRVHSLL